MFNCLYSACGIGRRRGITFGGSAEWR